MSYGMILDVCRNEEKKIFFYVYSETLKRMFREKSNKIISCYRNVYNEEFHSSQSSAITVRANNEEKLTAKDT
jgi:hypothetical protein